MFLTPASRAGRKRVGAATVAAPLALNFGTITANPGEPTPGMGLSIAGTWNNGAVTFDAPLFVNVTNTASAGGSLLYDFQVNATSLFSFSLSQPGSFVQVWGSGVSPHAVVKMGRSTGNEDATFGVAGSAGAFFNDSILGAGVIRGTNGSLLLGVGIGNTNTTIVIPASNQVMLQNAATTGVSLQVYKTTDSVSGTPTNYERGIFDWLVNTNVLTIGPQAGGTGSLRDMALYAATKNIWMFNASNVKIGTISGAVGAQHHRDYGGI